MLSLLDPEAIAGWLKHRQDKIKPISHESIYDWLYRPIQKKEKLWKFLPRHKAKRGLRKSRGAGVSRIPNRIPIQERPKVVDKKKRVWALGRRFDELSKEFSTHFPVLRERKTMFTLSAPLPSKRAPSTARR